MIRTALVILTASTGLSAPVPKVLKRPPALDGRWEAITLRSSGNDFLRSSPWVWDFDGDKVTRHYKQQDGSLRPEGTATIARPDPSSPNEVDYQLSSGNQSILFRARFEINGDELIINFAEANADRPPDMQELKRGYYYRFNRVRGK